MDRGLFAFGAVFLIVGVALGYFMVAYPEGLNPDWPIWAALLAPAAFALGGLHMMAEALRRPRLSGLMLRAILVCLWAIVNWAAFFSTHIDCAGRVSFLGAELFRWVPSEVECRNSLRAIVASIDSLVVMTAGIVVWQRARARRKEAEKIRPVG